MPTETQTQTLRERVAEAHANYEREQVERDAEQAQRRRERLKTAVFKKLDVEITDAAIIASDSGVPLVEIEGFRFALGSEGELAEVRTCGACGEDFYRTVYSVNSIGDSFIAYPHNNAYCLTLARQPEPSSTTEQRLLQALRDFIAEHGYQS
jgi:hypothetical protein